VITSAKYVDFGAAIPEIVDLRSAPVEKAATVEYWLKTTQKGSVDDQTWNSPCLMAHESGGDGDIYWGWINQQGDFGFSTSDLHDAAVTNQYVTDGQWHHIVMTKIWHLTTPCESRLYVDGGALNGGRSFEVTTSPGSPSQQDDDSPIQYLGFTQNGGSGDLQYIGLIDEVAIYTKPFNEAMARLHYLSAHVPAASFKITGITVDRTTLTVDLTWEATVGGSYTVRRAASALGPWTDIGQVTATTTQGTFQDPNRPAGAWFYRVVRN
jgi:hypothetical protein